MVCYVFYTTRDESQKLAENFAAELQNHGVTAVLIDTDSANGADLAEKYDIVSRPSALLARDDGSEVERYPLELPSAADVAYLARGI